MFHVLNVPMPVEEEALRTGRGHEEVKQCRSLKVGMTTLFD